jgi:dihydrofolate reductase
MGTVTSSATVSLDGLIAYPDDSVGALFDWYDAGEIAVSSANPRVSFHLTPPSAAYWQQMTAGLGALVVGRRLFDVTSGWGGVHPLGVPVVVVTSRPADPPSDSFSFAPDVATAVRRAVELAGDRDVSVAAGTIAGQALRLGLLDRVAMDLVPVVLGSGKPYFAGVEGTVVLADPTVCIRAPRVTHLVFPVR